MTTTLDSFEGELNVFVKQRTTWTLELVLCDSDEVALDLSSGYTAEMQVRSSPDEDPVVSVTSSSGITLQAGTNDDDPDNCVPNVIVTLADETTGVIEAGGYRYDLFVENTGSDDNECWITGKFTVRAAITHG